MFPATMPATIVSPPRTSGWPAARATFDSRLSSSQPAPPIACASGPGGFCGGEGGIIIRMVGHLFHILRVPDEVVLVQHEDRAALDAQVFDQRSVRFAERARAMVRQHLDPVHSEGA